MSEKMCVCVVVNNITVVLNFSKIKFLQFSIAFLILLHMSVVISVVI